VSDGSFYPATFRRFAMEKSIGNGSPPLRFTGDHLYLHIPFCRERCDYCDFFTRTGVDPGRQRAIVERMSAQVDQFTDSGITGMERSRSFRTLYVGGGTPSSMNSEAERALLALLGRYTGTGEVTVEVNPEDVSPAFLERLREAGVNRISLGVQTFSEAVRHTIGRHTTIAETRRGLETVAEEWGGRWTLDLIVAVPGEDEATVTRDLSDVLLYEPSHISVYELGIEERTVLGNRARRGRIVPISEDAAVRHLRVVEETLEKRGLHRYEISSYAVPGEESRHNLAYWRMRPHIGAGPGAVGTVPLRSSETDAVHRNAEDPSGAGYTPRPVGGTGGADRLDPKAPQSKRPPQIVRVTNTRSFGTYLKSPDFGVSVEPLSPFDVAAEICMMGLRTVEGFDDTMFRRYAGGSFSDICRRTVDRYPDAFVPGTPLPGASPDAGGSHRTGLNRFVAIHRTKWGILDSILVDLFRDIDEHRNSCGTDSCEVTGDPRS
jgi:oxygen-independent coproporphyrinogen-3 oxidase